MKKENRNKSLTAGVTNPVSLTSEERFLIRARELAEILRKEKPRESWPDWVWKCANGIWKQIFPKHFPRLLDESGQSFVAGFVVGCLPKLVEILSQPNSANTEMGLKTAFSVIPKENQKEALRFLQSENMKKEISRFISWGEMAPDFLSSPKEIRVAFAKGLLAGIMIDDDLGSFAKKASGTTFTLNLVLWISWPEIAKCSDISDAFQSIEAAYRTTGYSAPSHDAFKQYAHRIGLSQFLRKQKQSREP